MKKLSISSAGGYALLLAFPLLFLACGRSFAATPDPARNIQDRAAEMNEQRLRRLE
jgi:hypothetical protein